MRPSLLAVLVFLGCGGAGRETRPVESEPESEVGPDDSSDGMQIEGLMGSYGHDVVQGIQAQLQGPVMACYGDVLADHSYAYGRIRIAVRVGPNGRVRWAYAAETDIGHRGTERCIVERVVGHRFPRPQGGADAEASFAYEFAPAGRAASPAGEDRLGEVLEENRPAIDECTGGRPGFVLTLYVNREGAVTATGVAMPDENASGAADCLVEAVSGWMLPEGGSWYQKVVVEL